MMVDVTIPLKRWVNFQEVHRGQEACLYPFAQKDDQIRELGGEYDHGEKTIAAAKGRG